MHFLTKITAALLLALICVSAGAEPWMGSRFAKNCAACHAPGRVNVEDKQRRCTFSCKGCHVNPAGGGLSNFNGKWNEQRWLRSYFVDGYLGNKAENDPEPQIRTAFINAGADVRAIYLDFKDDTEHTSKMGLMATDLGVQVQPVQGVSLVWESRFLNDPRHTSVWDEGYTNASEVRSAYVLVDDMPWNSYFQYGIYRPMFGHYNPDHTTLFARSTGLDQSGSFKVATVGTAHNAPFINFNYLEPFTDHALAQDSGFVATIGMRFVTGGFYLMASYWNTMVKNWTNMLNTNRQMSSVTGGFTRGRLTMVADITRVVRNVEQGSRDLGMLVTVEPRLRVWKETYLKAGWEYLNTAPDLTFGKATQIGGGISAYLFTGFEWELMYKDLQFEQANIDHKEQNLWSQFHFYF